MPWTFKVARDQVTLEERQPWPHQLESFATWKNKRQYAMLWEMGTGKTGELANLIMNHLEAGRIGKALLFMPYRISYGWEWELLDGHGEKVLNLSDVGSSATRRKMLRAFKGRVVFMNYDGCAGIEDALFDWIADSKYACAADESTFIKNDRAQRSKSLCRLGEGASYRYILTGTPMPQGPQDIFGQYKFLDRSIFGASFSAFRACWLRLGGFNNKQILGLRRGQEANFNELVYSVADRRTKAECLGMPPKNYDLQKYKLSPEERKIYDQLAKDWVAEVKSGKISVQNGMIKALRLAQICTGFVGHVEDAERKLHQLGDSKIKALDELLDEVEGKVIIWCAWLENVNAVMALMEKKGIKAVAYTGQTKDADEAEMQFRKDPETRAFVGTGSSGGAGLNLQGPEVKTVIYFSQTHSNFLRQQSEDRAHRGGIKHTVTIIDLVAEKSIEMSIVRALRQHREVQDFLLQDPDKFVMGDVS